MRSTSPIFDFPSDTPIGPIVAGATPTLERLRKVLQPVVNLTKPVSGTIRALPPAPLDPDCSSVLLNCISICTCTAIQLLLLPRLICLLLPSLIHTSLLDLHKTVQHLPCGLDNPLLPPRSPAGHGSRFVCRYFGPS